ncbi:beta-N-acetylhexosaminidase [Salinisphaera sp.]|uniref:beta-N-acetylhexosaminidase n=1 Tax=Salinisphaera sp. TaxID=1914330 RepID=UPI0025F4D6E4|nr:beta-N-acetylhexosaminidase [Salinisphaera sp.]
MNETVPRPGPLMVDVAGTRLSAEDEQILAHPAVGSVIIFARNYEDPAQLAELTAAMRRVRPNLLIVADQEGGRVQRFREHFTRVVPMRAIGALAARDQAAGLHAAREIGWLLATELAQVGVDMPLAPVVDLDYGASTVIGDRAFSGDAATVGALAQALGEGLRDAGSASTAKHFPGHGYVVADSHAELPVDERDRTGLAEDMAPYGALIKQGLDSLMMAHVRYPAVDDLPASLSPRWIGDILRDEYGFDGCVFCDDLSMGGAAVIGGFAERARRAQDAGCDYLPICNDRAATLELLDAVCIDDDAAAARRQALHARCAGPLDGEQGTPLADNPRWQAAVALNAELAADANNGR